MQYGSVRHPSMGAKPIQFDAELLTKIESVTKIIITTSQKMVNLSSGRSPLDSSIRKSRRMNFLKPQSLPCTNRYARWLSAINTPTAQLLFRNWSCVTFSMWYYVRLANPHNDISNAHPSLWSLHVSHWVSRTWTLRALPTCCTPWGAGRAKGILCFLHRDLSD